MSFLSLTHMTYTIYVITLKSRLEMVGVGSFALYITMLYGDAVFMLFNQLFFLSLAQSLLVDESS